MLKLYLVSGGYTVHKCYTGAETLDCMEQTDLDLAILDVMRPDADGFQLCKKFREKSYCPIIMRTARTADGDKIMGLTIGLTAIIMVLVIQTTAGKKVVNMVE